jgi:hypothetical protein
MTAVALFLVILAGLCIIALAAAQWVAWAARRQFHDADNS